MKNEHFFLDWQTSETHYLSNPKLSSTQKQALISAQEVMPNLPGHLWILTSGSTQQNTFKWVALSKQAFLASAEAVNKHLQIEKDDRWLLALPLFHVGGLSILARAHLSRSEVFELPEPWSALKFHEFVLQKRISICSLVPTQIYDLVQLGRVCPASLRAIVVGGGALSSDLYAQARELSYPVLPSYGLTECCSQVATADLLSLKQFANPELKALSHVELRTNQDGLIEINSKSLLTGFMQIGENNCEFIDSANKDWFTTEDLGLCEDNTLQIFGRKSDQIKVLGELVYLPRLRSLLSTELPEAVIFSVPDDRDMHKICVALPRKNINTDVLKTLSRFNEQVAPFERLGQAYFVDEIPRTELGKVKEAELKSRLGF